MAANILSVLASSKFASKFADHDSWANRTPSREENRKYITTKISASCAFNEDLLLQVRMEDLELYEFNLTVDMANNCSIIDNAFENDK
jgi:hypothetical protein